MSLIGKGFDQLDTPTLWVDLDLLEKNIVTLATYFRQAQVGWRPHTKGIKIPAIAHQLIASGALGITCAKLSEAEVMAAAGIQDILVANQVVGEIKISRLVNLRRHANVMVAVDNIENARQISRAALNAGVKVRLLVELDSGMQRCGLKPGLNAVTFAYQVAELQGVEFAGFMAWEGHVVKIEDPIEKKAVTEKSVGSLVTTAALCREAGLEVPIVSCGGTGSFHTTAHIPGITEIQAGGGIFGDATYRRWGSGLDCALFILSTVISCPVPGRAVVDAGRKAMNIEYSMPEPLNLPGVKLKSCSAEHGMLELDAGAPVLNVGDRINFIVGYEDLTLFLHDRLVGMRNNIVEIIWDIQGRGKLY
jgi:D-serine deaminase-like pyridoxal phosphate-dependent protein